MSQESQPSRDLYVRMALTEQALLHAEEMAAQRDQMAAARLRVAEDQTGRLAQQLVQANQRIHQLEWWGWQTSTWMEAEQARVDGISARLDDQSRWAVRLRYAVAGLLLLTVAAAEYAGPEANRLARMLAKGLVGL